MNNNKTRLYLTVQVPYAEVVGKLDVKTDIAKYVVLDVVNQLKSKQIDNVKNIIKYLECYTNSYLLGNVTVVITLDVLDKTKDEIEEDRLKYFVEDVLKGNKEDNFKEEIKKMIKGVFDRL